jgi:hypothetical protein
MIADANQYQKVCEELESLEAWLARLRREHQGVDKGLTKSGIPKMISRVHES